MLSFGQFIASPDLQCVNEDAGSNDITLTWTNRNNPCGPFVAYYIYRSSNVNGPFTLIDSVLNQTQTTYTDVTAPAGTWYYYMESNYNCVGFTRRQSDTVCSQLPAIPDIVSVSVSGNSVIINWAESPSVQTHYYEVFIINNGNLTNPITVDQVVGIQNTTYTDNSQNPMLESINYTVAAFDSCGFSININTLPQRTMLLTHTLEPCDRLINLDWNRYINWPGGVKEYQIWLSTNGAPPAMVGSVDSSRQDFFFSAFNDFDSLCFTVRAVRADSTVFSNSNEVCFVAEIVQPPSYLALTDLTVNPANEIIAEWRIDTLAELATLDYQNSKDGINFSSLDFVALGNSFPEVFTYKDSITNPSIRAFYYRLNALDLCNTPYISTTGRTVHLDVELTDFFEMTLKWNLFEMEFASVRNYNIYRSDGNGSLFLASLPSNAREWVDDLTDDLNKNGTFCYRIEAEYDLFLPTGYSKSGSSFSNTECESHKALIYVPPVYIPSQNPEDFKPVLLFGNGSNYSMKIFSRWGELIFETNSVSFGWDATINGAAAPTGGYPYLIEFRASDGTMIIEEGILTLIR
ncbi:MAG: hypothetical protein HKN92_03260 [Chitinophagales bacterium]|nr:hypothetical protein [Chitinophagales bacterium]